ncbi:unnamed protein product [Durusdinium trenchii]|uniref:Uncharacterized protein n=1 Tax=Durusdinium trenchii TaxID=1381693 RepID=A0ABP0LPH6_9DINO
MPRSSRNSGLVVLVCFLFGGCTFVNTGLSRPISTARGHTQFWPMGHKQDMRTGLVQLPQQAMSLGQSLSASCLGPTLLGLWRSEYGVSYGYGSAVEPTLHVHFLSRFRFMKGNLLCKRLGNIVECAE